MKEAFRLMRKRGLLARMNFLCCSNCAGHELTNMAVDAIRSGKKKQDDIKGCVFYHRQDAEALEPPRARWRCSGNQPLMIRYGLLDSKEFGEIGLPTDEVGRIVCECLDEAQVAYSWPDEDPNLCIEVDVATALEPKVEPEERKVAHG